jgi:hypothetical protein
MTQRKCDWAVSAVMILPTPASASLLRLGEEPIRTLTDRTTGLAANALGNTNRSGFAIGAKSPSIPIRA